MFLSSGKNEYCMCRRFLESLEKSVEGSLRKHMDLIDDVHAVPSDLRRDAHLIHQGLDIFDAIVRCCIQLVNAI